MFRCNNKVCVEPHCHRRKSWRSKWYVNVPVKWSVRVSWEFDFFSSQANRVFGFGLRTMPQRFFRINNHFEVCLECHKRLLRHHSVAMRDTKATDRIALICTLWMPQPKGNMINWSGIPTWKPSISLWRRHVRTLRLVQRDDAVAFK